MLYCFRLIIYDDGEVVLLKYEITRFICRAILYTSTLLLAEDLVNVKSRLFYMRYSQHMWIDVALFLYTIYLYTIL